MTEDAIRLPGRRVIAATLRGASERLIRELNTPGEEAPDWTDFEWRAAIAVSAMYGITGLLAERLRWRGPPVWQDFLAEQLQQGRLREQRVRSLLARLDAAGKAAGLPLMALKGSAILDMGLYSPGVRPQSDIDLLCRPEDEAAAARVIESLGYVLGDVAWKHTDFGPAGQAEERLFGENIRNPHKIELHVRIAERLPYRELGIDVLRPDAQPGLNSYADSGVLLKHLLLHAAGNLSTRGSRLIQLHDIALLCRGFGNTALYRAFSSDAVPGWAWPVFAMVERCFPGSVEASVLKRAAAACPWWLRRQIERQPFVAMTLANPRIPALPGLAWATSLDAALEYAWRQLVPDRASRQLRLSIAPKQPMTRGSAWAVQPQWLRVLRWLFAPPPRVMTTYALRTACSYTPTAEC